MNICCDMDGVIFDIMSEFIRIHNELYGDNKTLEDVDKYEFYDDWGLNLGETFWIFNIIDQRNTKLLDPDISDYLEVMNTLYDVDIVTLKPEFKREMIIDALALNGIYEGIHYNNLIIKPYNITDIKASLDYDIYIDDSSKLAETIKKDESKTILLYDSPWNRKFETNGDNCRRVYGWHDLLVLLEMITK